MDKTILGSLLLKLSSIHSTAVNESLITFVSTENSISAFLECGPQGTEAFTNILVNPWDDTDRKREILRRSLSELSTRLNKSEDIQTQITLLNSFIRLFRVDSSLTMEALPIPALLNLLPSSTPSSVG